MTLIQRQDALVAKLEPIYVEFHKRGAKGFGGDLAGKRSRLNRLHCEELVAAGYTRREAADSAEQCNAVASLNASHAAYIEQMGGAA